MTKKETVVLYGYNESKITRRTRISKAGKKSSRISIDIEATPVVHSFDEAKAGKGVAEAIVELLREQIEAISVNAKPETVARRNRYVANHSTANGQKRYSGGRIGNTPPVHGTKLFGDSGRLAKGLYLRFVRSANEFTTNVPANRLRGPTEHLAKRLAQLLPALRNPRSIITDSRVSEAIGKTLEDMISVARSQRDVKRQQLRAAQGSVLRGVVGAFL